MELYLNVKLNSTCIIFCMVGQTINSVVHKDFSVTFTFKIFSSKNNLIIIKTLMIQSESTNDF